MFDRGRTASGPPKMDRTPPARDLCGDRLPGGCNELRPKSASHACRKPSVFWTIVWKRYRQTPTLSYI